MFGAVPLAHLLQANGQRAESEKLLDETLAWVNSKRDPRREDFLGWPYRRVRADALALQGHRDAAVAALAEAFRLGEREDWWYTIERDPLWESMRSDPRFQAIAAEARAHAAAQRALLEEMRRKGEVPRKAGARRCAARRPRRRHLPTRDNRLPRAEHSQLSGAGRRRGRSMASHCSFATCAGVSALPVRFR